MEEPLGMPTPMETKERTIETKVGDTFQVSFWEDRTLGYAWYPVYDETVFDLIEDDYQRTIQTHTADSGKRLFRFLRLKPGNYEIRFEKRSVGNSPLRTGSFIRSR